MNLFKKVIFVLGSVLISISLIWIIYLEMLSLGTFRFGFSDYIFTMIKLMLPMFLGSFLIIRSISSGLKRKAIITLEILYLFMYGLVVSFLVFGGLRGLFIDQDANISLKAYLELNSNIIPFKTIKLYIDSFFYETLNKSIVIENLVGNLIMFMPIGFFLPAIFKSQRKILNFLMLSTFILLGVEIIQLVFRLGSLDIDDFILNMSGACLMYGIIRINRVKKYLIKKQLF